MNSNLDIIDNTETTGNSEINENIYFKKFIQLKKYLRRNESKFLEIERANLKAIKQIYSLLNSEQKIRLIRKLKKLSDFLFKFAKNSEFLGKIEKKSRI